jgi:hypothetical protein
VIRKIDFEDDKLFKTMVITTLFGTPPSMLKKVFIEGVILLS